MHIYSASVWAAAGGKARVGVRPSLGKSRNNFFSIRGTFLLIFIRIGGLFLSVWEPFSPCGVHALIVLMGNLFWACSPLQNFLRALCICASNLCIVQGGHYIDKVIIINAVQLSTVRPSVLVIGSVIL